jgi:hypothetical protein
LFLKKAYNDFSEHQEATISYFSQRQDEAGGPLGMNSVSDFTGYGFVIFEAAPINQFPIQLVMNEADTPLYQEKLEIFPNFFNRNEIRSNVVQAFLYRTQQNQFDEFRWLLSILRFLSVDNQADLMDLKKSCLGNQRNQQEFPINQFEP